jgi:hypothetical protein
MELQTISTAVAMMPILEQIHQPPPALVVLATLRRVAIRSHVVTRTGMGLQTTTTVVVTKRSSRIPAPLVVLPLTAPQTHVAQPMKSVQIPHSLLAVAAITFTRCTLVWLFQHFYIVSANLCRAAGSGDFRCL